MQQWASHKPNVMLVVDEDMQKFEPISLLAYDCQRPHVHERSAIAVWCNALRAHERSSKRDATAVARWIRHERGPQLLAAAAVPATAAAARRARAS